MAALTLTAAALPDPVAGVPAGSNANTTNAASWTFDGGSGGEDTIANAQFMKGVDGKSRLGAVLSKSYRSQQALDAALAGMGAVISCNGATAFRFVTAGPGTPTATLTTLGPTGSLRVSIGFNHVTAN